MRVSLHVSVCVYKDITRVGEYLMKVNHKNDPINAIAELRRPRICWLQVWYRPPLECNSSTDVAGYTDLSMDVPVYQEVANSQMIRRAVQGRETGQAHQEGALVFCFTIFPSQCLTYPRLVLGLGKERGEEIALDLKWASSDRDTIPAHRIYVDFQHCQQ